MRCSSWLLILLPFVLGGCPRQDLTRSCPPAAVKPEPVIVERKVYVSIPAELTPEPVVAEGPLSECPNVAAARRKTIETCAANMRKIRGIQGTAVKP